MLEPRPRRPIARVAGALAAVCLAGCLAGCKTPPLQSARDQFYAGRFEAAATNLADIPAGDKDEVLYLMERGMIRQAAGAAAGSADDWRRAADRDAQLETYSLSKGASSLVVNDRTLPFRGMPFERILLYAFLAKTYWTLGNWDFAAICGRNIIQRLEARDGFPDIAYARYLAGFCLELIQDTGNAAIQYRYAGQMLSNSLLVDAESGGFRPRAADPAPGAPADLPGELICFVALGRAPPERGPGPGFDSPAPYAELYAGDRRLGRSYPFSNTADLMAASQRRLAAIQMAKDAARVATKVALSEALEQQNETLGALLWLALFAAEMPDTRCWETLPLWLQVARVRCPADLPRFTVVFRNAAGAPVRSPIAAAPIARRGRTYIGFCRDLGPAPAE